MSNTLTSYKTIVSIAGTKLKRVRVVLARNREYAAQMVGRSPGDRVTIQSASMLDDMLVRLKTKWLGGGARSLRKFYTELRFSLKADNSLPNGFRRVAPTIDAALLANATVAAIEAANSAKGMDAMLNCMTGVLPHEHIERLRTAAGTGETPQVIEQLAKLLDKRVKLIAKLVQTSISPVITIVFALGASLFIAKAQLPQMAQMFKSAKKSLPDQTQNLLDIVNAVERFPVLGILIVASPVILAFAVKYAYERVPKFQDVVDKLPVIGPTMERVRWAKMLRTFAMLRSNSSSITMYDSLILTSRISKHFRTVAFLRGTAETIRSKSCQLFEAARVNQAKLGDADTRWIDTIPLGEESGDVAGLLGTIAEEYEERAEAAIESLPKFVEFVSLGIAATIVGYVMLASILPSFRLGSVLH